MSRPDGPTLPVGRVALLFTDVQGSTALLHQLGDAFGDVLDEHDRILRGVFKEFGGVEVDNEGDAFFVVFADHTRAVEAAAAAQQRLAKGAWPDGVELRVRMALHSGEPAIRGHKYWGVDVHYAARLGSAAHGGQVLLSADMRAQVPDAATESLGRHGVKDFPVAREIFHLAIDRSSASEFPPPRTLTTERSNLPTIHTPIIGREDVLADLRSRLTGPDRLVSLVGPGGVGKTRTAIAAGERLTGRFPHGAAFVSLAAVREASEAPGAIAEALQSTILRDADPEAALAALLKGHRGLLILDNAEHLPGLSGLLARLLEVAPDPRWLVTSQAPLNIRAETVVRLGPLEVPFEPERSADELEVVPACALFLERVRSRIPGYDVTEVDQKPLIRLCRNLEGMPLALELAAARLPMMGLARLVEAIGADVDSALGSGPGDLPERQRGLHAALDWTVALLTDGEREVYAGCAAFAQAWSIEDSEQMWAGAADSGQVWDALARLLDLSLVVQRGDGRFTMPERVRRHALEVLVASGEERVRRTRHAEVIAERVRRLMSERTHDFDRAVADLGDLTEEMLHALEWTAEHDRVTYRLALSVCAWPLYLSGRVQTFIADILDFALAGKPRDAALSRICVDAGSRLVGSDRDPDERWRLTELSIEVADEAGDADDRFYALGGKVELLLGLGRFDDARTVLDGAIAVAKEIGDDIRAEALEHWHARIDLEAGDFVSAERRFRAILSAPHRNTYISAAIGTYLGDCAFGRGEFRAAVDHWADFLSTMAPSSLVNVLLQIYAIAGACAGLEEDEAAAELRAGAAHFYETRTGQPWTDLALDWLEDPLIESSQRLSPDVLDAARHRGKRLGYEAMIARTHEIAAEVSG